MVRSIRGRCFRDLPIRLAWIWVAPPDIFTHDILKVQHKTRQGDGCKAICAAMPAAR